MTIIHFISTEEVRHLCNLPCFNKAADADWKHTLYMFSQPRKHMLLRGGF